MALRVPHNLVGGARSYLSGIAAREHVRFRAELLLDAYRKRRDAYASRAAEKGCAYEHGKAKARTARILAARGMVPTPRQEGQVHTLAFFPTWSWHPQLLAPLRALGDVSHFDYRAHGVDPVLLYRRDPSMVAARKNACDAFVKHARDLQRKKPIDWVFVYANGLEILADTLDQVREATGAPIVSMCLDDKHSWEVRGLGNQRGGQIDIAARFDLAWSVSRVACEWYMVEGGNPYFLGEGCSPDLYLSHDPHPVHDVCFIGQAYGFRPGFVGALRRAGISVATRGAGWPEGPASEGELTSLMRASKVILGLSGVGWAEHFRSMKGRDFDGPCVGAYVTSFNADLAPFFRIGEEIECFATVEDAVDVLRGLLRDDARRRKVAAAGRARCLREHTWVHRFREILDVLGILEAPLNRAEPGRNQSGVVGDPAGSP